MTSTGKMPMAGLFITGGTGFVGNAVLRQLAGRQLAGRGIRDVTVLARSRDARYSRIDGPGWRRVTADILDPGSYAAALPEGGTVLHMAAATGRASAQRHRVVNVEGTRRLLEAAREAGIARIVFVSSIAARFEDIRWYPYAASKREAELLIRGSGLRFTIVRPTMVFGPGSPVERGLMRLATAPVPFVFGSGRVQVQPIDVQALAGRLIELALDSDCADGVVEVGGPEVVELNQLLARMRRGAGKRPMRVRHLPAGPVRTVLAVIEAMIGPRLPITAGQLASFLNDGIAGTPERVGGQSGRSTELTV